MFEILSTCKSGGYLYCRTNPQHPKANSKGLYPLHRVVIENELGRLLNSQEDVHHINEIKTDNRIENLEVLPRSEHARKHAKPVFASTICPNCSKQFHLKPSVLRLRGRRNKSGKVFCTRSCGTFFIKKNEKTERCNKG
jgi:hypothetical protein